MYTIKDALAQALDGIKDATKIGIGTWLGIVVGTAMKLALAFAMVGMFVLVWWL